MSIIAGWASAAMYSQEKFPDGFHLSCQNNWVKYCIIGALINNETLTYRFFTLGACSQAHPILFICPYVQREGQLDGGTPSLYSVMSFSEAFCPLAEQ